MPQLLVYNLKGAATVGTVYLAQKVFRDSFSANFKLLTIEIEPIFKTDS